MPQKTVQLSSICLLLFCFSLETPSLFGTSFPCGHCTGLMRRLAFLTTSVTDFSDKSVTCPTVCATQKLCHSDILSVLLSHYDMVNAIPEIGALVHP